VSRLSRRKWVTIGVVAPAALVTVLFASGVTAESSRASSRWNHVRATGEAAQSAIESGAEAAYRGPVWRELRLTEVYGPKYTFVDVGRKGDSPGDYGVFRDPVLDNKGTRVGTIDVQCIAAYADQCQGSIRIAGRGQIIFGGITPLGRDPDWFAVTGGTGMFTGVGGTLKVEFPNSDRARLTVTLTR
jgi:hypothetical protein